MTGAESAMGETTGTEAAAKSDSDAFTLACTTAPHILHFIAFPAQAAGNFRRFPQAGHAARTLAIVAPNRIPIGGMIRGKSSVPQGVTMRMANPI